MRENKGHDRRFFLKFCKHTSLLFIIQQFFTIYIIFKSALSVEVHRINLPSQNTAPAGTVRMQIHSRKFQVLLEVHETNFSLQTFLRLKYLQSC